MREYWLMHIARTGLMHSADRACPEFFLTGEDIYDTFSKVFKVLCCKYAKKEHRNAR